LGLIDSLRRKKIVKKENANYEALIEIYNQEFDKLSAASKLKMVKVSS